MKFDHKLTTMLLSGAFALLQPSTFATEKESDPLAPNNSISIFTNNASNNNNSIVISTEINKHNILPIETQNYLTELGYDILKNILSNNNIDMSSSSLYEDVHKQLELDWNKTTYSKVATYMPTLWGRWLFTSTDAVYNKKRKNSMMAIVTLSWALMDLAKKQNDFFERGSFTLIDPTHRLTNFLLDYVKLVMGVEEPKNFSYKDTQSNFAYPRKPEEGYSSHHKEHCPESQFGIDVRFEASEVVKMLLPSCGPHGGTHLLFAKLDIQNQEEPLLFIKLEKIGLGNAGAKMIHGVDYVKSKIYVEADARREKDVRPEIKDSFKQLQKEIKFEGDFTTVRSMYLAAQKLLETTEMAKTFLDTVNNIYPYGNNHLRVGNEVIIDLRNLAH